MSKNKKLLVLSLCVCLICGMATTVGTMKKAADLASNEVEYVNDDTSDILEHDGEILVDSLKLKKVEGSNDAVTGSGVTETVLSDDVYDKGSSEYFDELRATVDMDRNQVISMLSDVIAEAQTEEEKSNATTKKLEIIEYMNLENNIESIIETKGLPECFVLISETSVNVTVNKQEIAEQEVAKICDIIMRETGREASQIVIQSTY